MTTITVLGLGAMGSRMATKLVEAGHDVRVYNRSPRTLDGARAFDSPEAAARGASVVLSMVTDDGASRAVWTGDEGALGGLAEGATAIACSTLTPARVRELGAAVAARGARFLDAPVVGTRPHADAGGLTFLVGGDDSALSDVRELLAPMGKVRHVGPVGAGATVKLAVNALFGIQVAAFAEVLSYLRRAGIEGSELVAGLPITSPALARVTQLIAARSFAPNFPIDLVAKDFRYVAQAAGAVGAEVPLSEAVGRVYARAAEEGFGGDDISGVAQLFD